MTSALGEQRLNEPRGPASACILPCKCCKSWRVEWCSICSMFRNWPCRVLIETLIAKKVHIWTSDTKEKEDRDMNRTTAHPVSDLISTKIASPCMFRVELALQSSLWPLTTALTRKLRQISNCISYHCSAALRKFDFSANPLQSFLTLRLKLCHLAWIHSTEFWEISS